MASDRAGYGGIKLAGPVFLFLGYGWCCRGRGGNRLGWGSLYHGLQPSP